MIDIRRYDNKMKFITFIIILILLMAMGRYFHIDVERLQASLAKYPVLLAGIIFVVLYVVVTFFIWLSKDIFRISAAVLFGPILSTIFVFIAELINVLILFNFSRFLGRGFVEEYLKGSAKNLDGKIARVNFLWLFIFRTVPLIPFRFMDLAAGLTKLSLRKYLIVAVLGSPARIFWLQCILATVGKGIFAKPEVMINYLMLNKSAFIFTFVYLVLAIVVLLKLKQKNK